MKNNKVKAVILSAVIAFTATPLVSTAEYVQHSIMDYEFKELLEMSEEEICSISEEVKYSYHGGTIQKKNNTVRYLVCLETADPYLKNAETQEVDREKLISVIGLPADMVTFFDEVLYFEESCMDDTIYPSIELFIDLNVYSEYDVWKVCRIVNAILNNNPAIPVCNQIMYASDMDPSDIQNSALTITTDTFTYTNNNRYNFQNGFLLESELADPDFMVVGMTYYTSEPEKLFGYVVAPINSDRLGSGGIGIFYHGTIEEELGDAELQVGDLLKVDGMVECTDIYPTTYVPAEDATMSCLGNGVDIFGEEFKRVIRLQMVIEQAEFNERSENGAIYNIDLIKGDVNVDDELNILDCIQINKAMLAGAPLCDYAKLVGDVNENGGLDMDDSLCILKETIGLTENFE